MKQRGMSVESYSARKAARASVAQWSFALAAGVLCLLGAANSRATTVNVTGGPGLDQGSICLASGLCPSSSPAYNLSGDGAVSGSFVYTPGSGSGGTVSFDLTLTSPASFTATSGSTTPSSIQLLANSTFSGTVSVTSSADGSGIEVSQTGLALSNNDVLNFSTGTSATQTTPIISGLTCTIGTGGDLCGLTLGPTDLQFSSGGTSYNAQWTFDTTVVPVPLPASSWLVLSGVGGLALLARRRRAAQI